VLATHIILGDPSVITKECTAIPSEFEGTIERDKERYKESETDRLERERERHRERQREGGREEKQKGQALTCLFVQYQSNLREC
jgi:hypothetical protein